MSRLVASFTILIFGLLLALQCLILNQSTALEDLSINHANRSLLSGVSTEATHLVIKIGTMRKASLMQDGEVIGAVVLECNGRVLIDGQATIIWLLQSVNGKSSLDDFTKFLANHEVLKDNLKPIAFDPASPYGDQRAYFIAFSPPGGQYPYTVLDPETDSFYREDGWQMFNYPSKTPIGSYRVRFNKD